MRKPRFKPDSLPVFYHLYNRVAGEPGFQPFGPAEKEKFVRLLHRLQRFFSIEILAFQVMSNHFHLLVYAPADPPSPDEVARRYNTYYRGRRSISPDDPRCHELGERMRDISWFMHALQQQFATWFNLSRPIPRRGSLWANRFKHTLLGGADAVWACWKYIEMNPVRAGLVQDAADYRFGSYGAWHGRGTYPFEENLRRRLLPLLQGLYPFRSIEQLLTALRDALSSIKRRRPVIETELTETLKALDRQARCWIDGLIVGSAVFLRDMIAISNGVLQAKPDLPDPAGCMDGIPTGLHTYNSRCAVR